MNSGIIIANETMGIQSLRDGCRSGGRNGDVAFCGRESKTDSTTDRGRAGRNRVGTDGGSS